MKNTIARLAGALLALMLTTGLAAAQSKVTIAIGGGACLCYLPTVLAKQLGEYEKAGLNVDLVDLKGGSTHSRPCSAAAPTWFPAISTIASTWRPKAGAAGVRGL